MKNKKSKTAARRMRKLQRRMAKLVFVSAVRSGVNPQILRNEIL